MVPHQRYHAFAFEARQWVEIGCMVAQKEIAMLWILEEAVQKSVEGSEYEARVPKVPDPPS